MPTGFYGKIGLGKSAGINTDTVISEHLDIDLFHSHRATDEKIKDHLDVENNNTYEIAIGYRYPQLPWFSTELDFSYNSKASLNGNHLVLEEKNFDEPTHLNIQNTTLMAVGIVDIATYFDRDTWLFHPYIGLGLGISRNRTGSLHDHENHREFNFDTHDTILILPG